MEPAAHPGSDLLRFSVVGSVDDGKSTLIGRLLHDTRSIPDDQLSALRADSARLSPGAALDFALLTDGLRAEREQGITIDVAYRYFSTARRSFIVADTPGHEQYTRNMATGASTANLAIILVDARLGILTQTRRHSFLASLLGVRRLLVAVNKMDLVDFSAEVFGRLAADYRDFAARLEVADLQFVPVSARHGDNVVARSPRTPWYHGPSVLEYLETVYVGSDRNLIDFRLPVQYVVRSGPRAFCGQIASGTVKPGDEIMVLPSGHTSRVRSIVEPGGERPYAFAPMSVAVTLEDEIDVSRGDLLVHPRNVPPVQSHFEAMLLWMAEEPMDPGLVYLLKHTTRLTRAAIQRIEYRVDVDTLSRAPAQPLQLNEIARVAFQTHQKICIDPYRKNKVTGSFILIHPRSHHTVAAGLIIDRRPELGLQGPGAAGLPRSEHIRREVGRVTAADREQLLGQRAVTVWFTGLPGSGKSSIARALEQRLHQGERHVSVLDGDNLRFGLNRDLAFSAADRRENIRRIAEVARLFNEAGTIALVSVISPFAADREEARRIIGPDRFVEVYLSTAARGVRGPRRQGPVPAGPGRGDPGLHRNQRALRAARAPHPDARYGPARAGGVRRAGAGRGGAADRAGT